MSSRQRLVEACLIADCPNYAQAGKALCHAHQKRKARGQPLEGPVAKHGDHPLHRLQQASHVFSDADTANELEYRRALDVLKYAAKEWVASLNEKASQKKSAKIDTVLPYGREGGGRN